MARKLSRGQKLLSQEQAEHYARYRALTNEIEAVHAQMIERTARYWLAIWEIHHDKLWRVAYPIQEAWVRSLCAESFGPTRALLFKIMTRFDVLAAHGLDRSEIAFAIGSGKTAIVHDFDKLFLRQGRGKWIIRPDVQARLNEEGSSVRDKVLEIAALGAGEARTAVSDLANERRVFCAELLWQEGRALAKLVETGGEEQNTVYDVVVLAHQPLSAVAIDYITKGLDRSTL